MINRVQNINLYGRPMEGAPCLEPLEQSVLSSSFAVRLLYDLYDLFHEGITKKVSNWTVNLWRGLLT